MDSHIYETEYYRDKYENARQNIFLDIWKASQYLSGRIVFRTTTKTALEIWGAENL